MPRRDKVVLANPLAATSFGRAPCLEEREKASRALRERWAMREKVQPQMVGSVRTVLSAQRAAQGPTVCPVKVAVVVQPRVRRCCAVLTPVLFQQVVAREEPEVAGALPPREETLAVRALAC